jgi:hypothetical protein
LDVNREDPVELALASDLQKSVPIHVVGSSCGIFKIAGGLPCAGRGDEEVELNSKNRKEPFE